MKRIIFLVALVLCSRASAEDVTQACGPGIYCVERMLCLGHVAPTPLKGVSQKYQAESTSFRSGKLITKEGFVGDFTQVNEQNVGDKPGLTIEQASALADWTGGDPAPPLKLDGKTVTTWASATTDGMVLVITSSQSRDGHRIDHLTGTEYRKIPHLDPYLLDYDCEATVVDVPSLVVFEKVK